MQTESLAGWLDNIPALNLPSFTPSAPAPVAGTATTSPSWLQTFATTATQAYANVLQLKQQNNLAKLNLERARLGYPALDAPAGDYPQASGGGYPAPGGYGPNAGRYLPLILGGALLLGGAAYLAKSRR